MVTGKSGPLRTNIRIIPVRSPYRTLTDSSAYPAAFDTLTPGTYLVVRDEEEKSSSWPI